MLLLLLLSACGHLPSEGQAPDGVAECLDTRPAYAGCSAEVVQVDSTGAVVRGATHVWDEAGNEVYLTEEMHGSPAQEVFMTWDDEGHLEQWTAGYIGGPIAARTTYAYEGGLLREKLSWIANPGGSERVRYTHDTDGQLIVEETDYDDDGTTDSVTTNTWADGFLVREETDSGGDGTVDSTCVTTWNLVAAGSVATQACFDREGNPEGFLTVTARNTRGEVEAVHLDVDRDGTEDWVGTWTWNDRCLLEAERSEALDRENYTTGTDYDHDELGRITVEEEYASIVNADSSIETDEGRATWTYDCPDR